MKINYGITIIYYNPDEYVLRKLKTYSAAFEHVLIVDNSDKTTIDYSNILSMYENITVHRMNGNEGMSMALNYAYNWGIEHGIDIMATMDQDSDYCINSINNMKNYINKNFSNDIAIFGSNFAKLYLDKKANKMVAYEPQINREEIKEVEMCITSGSFVNLGIVGTILPLDDYFIAEVDTIMCDILRKKGYRLIRVGSAYFEQQVGYPVANTWFNRKFKILHHSTIRYYYLFRNGLYRAKINQKRFYCLITFLRYFVNIIISEDNKIKKIRACINGIIDYRHGIIGERKIIIDE